MQKMKMLIILFFMAFISCDQESERSKYIPLVNPDATTEARNLYRFIQDISGTYTLSGQHNFCGKDSAYTDQLEKLTGKKAVIWGSDFSWCAEGESAPGYQHCGPLNLSAPDTPFEFLDITMEEARKRMVEEIKIRHAEGHIITLMWHGCFPTDGDCCDGSSIWAMENRPTPEAWNELTTEGTPLNDAWKVGVDKIAVHLKVLQQARIPVLWRPYHEMNGVWFWWCNQPGEQGFKRLWIMMYNYLTHHHKLNNLIWVWNPNAPRDRLNDEAWPYKDFYPGNEYVDILAADVYRNDYKQSHHDELIELGGGKPLALGEVGNIPDPEILKDQTLWTWYMPWGWLHFRSNPDSLIKKLITDERVLTLDEIEASGKGQIRIR